MALRGSAPDLGNADVSASCVAAARLHALTVQGWFSPCTPPTSCRSCTAPSSVAAPQAGD
eukprot:5461524-Pyramimonas_sp.AAC.1